MPNPTGVPAFGGYFTERVGVDHEVIHAWWADGSYAYWHAEDGRWKPLQRPDFAALFPDRVTREPETMSVEEIYRELCPPLPFRGDLPAQPRPDDADPLTYPARGGRDD